MGRKHDQLSEFDLLIEDEEEGSDAGKRPSSSSRTCITRPLFAAVGFLLVASIASSLVFLSTIERSGSIIQDLSLVFLDEESVGPGWRFITSVPSALPPPEQIERPTLAETFFSPKCAEAWIASGVLCDEIEEGAISQEMREALKLSIIHTWVNGTDKRLYDWKEAVFKGQPPTAPGRVIQPGDAARHFREHGELVHSLRSVIRSLPADEIADLHLVTGDLPLRDVDGMPVGQMRIGQIPTWLDLKHSQCSSDSNLRVHHHWDLYKMRGEGAVESKANIWRENVLPTFNSIGIETQLVTLAPELTDTVLYFNDDFFLTQNLTRTDFSSPLFGSVLRMQNNPRVSSSAKGTSTADPDGEWPSLGYANWLLDERFGTRTRPYLSHFVKTYSAPLLQELAAIWGEEFTESAAVRFRGAGHGSAFGLAFLASSYIVERHREALLWSFLVARSDRDGSGTYSLAERHALLREIGLTGQQSNRSMLVVPEPIRLMSDEVDDALVKAGFRTPGSTHYTFISQESGYGYAWLEGRPVLFKDSYVLTNEPRPMNNGWPRYRPGDNTGDQIACTFEPVDCFGDSFLAPEGEEVSVQDTLRRVAFEKPRCGDCIISSLLGASGRRGFSAFLPEPSVDAAPSDRVALSMSKSWADAEYDVRGGRARAIALLQRYSYVLGDSAGELLKVTNSYTMSRQLDKLLAAIREPGGPAFVVLNDDMYDRTLPKQAAAVDELMRKWMETLWPDKMCWES